MTDKYGVMTDDERLKEAKEAIKSMPPITQPIDIVTIGDGPDDLTGTGFGTTGLNTKKRIMRVYDVEDIDDDKVSVIAYLKKLDFGNYVDTYYDCEDRAFWGVAHVRHRFPGVPIGVASGIVPSGHPLLRGKDPGTKIAHAIIILWYNGKRGLEYLHWDPLPVSVGGGKKVPYGKVNLPGLDEVASITAFPIGRGPDETTTPVTSDKFVSLDGSALIFDKDRLIYPLRDGGKGILEYLMGKQYETKCDDMKYHKIASSQRNFDKRWKDYDEALWAFAHVRRAYPGCPIGVAIGKPGDDAKSSAVVILRYNKGDVKGGDPAWMYWDPEVPNKAGVKFTPKMMFM